MACLHYCYSCRSSSSDHAHATRMPAAPPQQLQHTVAYNVSEVHRHQWLTMMLPLQEGIISRRSSSNDHVHATNMSMQRLHSSYSIQWPTMSPRFHRHQWPTMMLPLQEGIISCRSSSNDHVHATNMSRQPCNKHVQAVPSQQLQHIALRITSQAPSFWFLAADHAWSSTCDHATIS